MQTLAYTALERLSVSPPVDRLAWLEQAAQGKVVLDLGAYDETAVEHKRDTEYWLHARLARSARYVIGVDSSARLPETGLQTSPNSKILRGDVNRLEELPEAQAADVIMACELIEHLPDALGFLRGLQRNRAFAGKSFVATTPNAVSFHNACIGVFNRESTHHDHLQIYSFKTLTTLFHRAGFSRFELIPYHALFAEMLLQSSGLERYAVSLFQRFVGFSERRFPLLCGGWIVEATI